MHHPVVSPEDAYRDGTGVIIFCMNHVFDHHILLHCFVVVAVNSKQHTGYDDDVGAAERMPSIETKFLLYRMEALCSRQESTKRRGYLCAPDVVATLTELQSQRLPISFSSMAQVSRTAIEAIIQLAMTK